MESTLEMALIDGIKSGLLNEQSIKFLSERFSHHVTATSYKGSKERLPSPEEIAHKQQLQQKLKQTLRNAQKSRSKKL